MRIASVCVSPRDDEAIRAELERRGEWSPPWLRPRAPPAGGANSLPSAGSLAGSPSPPGENHLVDDDDADDAGDDPWISDPWASDADSASHSGDQDGEDPGFESE